MQYVGKTRNIYAFMLDRMAQAVLPLQGQESIGTGRLGSKVIWQQCGAGLRLLSFLHRLDGVE